MKIVIAPRFNHLAGFLESLPNRFDVEGKTLNDKRNVIKLFHVDGLDIVVKRFRKPLWVQRIAYTFFRKTKAERAFLYGTELVSRGFLTAPSMAYLEHKSNGLMDDCYYVCGFDPNPPIEELTDQPIQDRGLIEDFSLFVKELHCKGILHHDLNCSNVLYHLQSDGHYAFSLIDNNRMMFYPQGEMPPLDECMENLTRFTGDMGLFRSVAESYCRVRRLPEGSVEKMMEVKRAHDEKYSRRKRMKAKLRKKRKD